MCVSRASSPRCLPPCLGVFRSGTQRRDIHIVRALGWMESQSVQSGRVGGRTVTLASHSPGCTGSWGEVRETREAREGGLSVSVLFRGAPLAERACGVAWLPGV